MIPLSIEKQREPKKGDLLLSEPFLADNDFTRSVILLCEHNTDGSFGFILNNTLDLKLHEFTNGFPETETTVGYGGPVDRNQLFFLHQCPDLSDSIEIVKGIYIGGNFNELLECIEKGTVNESEVRFFIGYTGWGPEQLASEIEEKTWIVTDIPEQITVMNTDDDRLWKEILLYLGGKYKLMADFPLDPSHN